MEYSQELKDTLATAFNEALKRRHEFVTLEHVLYALLDDPNGKRILLACGGDLKELRKDLEDFFENNMPALNVELDQDPQQTLAFQRVFQRAVMHVQSSGKTVMDSSNLLVAFFRENDSYAVHLMQKQDITRLDVVRYISHGIAKVKESGAEEGAHFEETARQNSNREEKEKSPLEAYATDLVALAEQGKIDPLIGRNKEIERTLQVLCRRRKNNPIFVGDPGVGKTALAEGLALQIYEGKVPEILKNARIFSLDMGSLLAGTKFRGDFEERLKGVLNEIKSITDAILFVDEIHTVVGAGATQDGSLDAANLIKPALQNGELRCIGSTTHRDFKASIEKDHALARRFQKITVREPTIEETVRILEGLASRYEAHHGVKYSPAALQSAAELSGKHINERFLPDKAIDVIDEAGAAQRLATEENRKERIEPNDIEAIVAKMAQIPPKSVSTDDRAALANLAKELKLVLFGQDSAIDAVAQAIKLNRSGLGSPERPVGSFLFAGPTGVGKTELAKQLARILGVEFQRFDMSEYMEKHTVSRLIGAPPGYVGFDQGGLLTDAIRKTPHCILLLDEIEKAHPDIYNVLLQVMDHATLTDNNGRQADFRHVTLIMTTNAGAREIAQARIGFSREGDTPSADKALENVFSPEFRNRLDAVITFGQLPREVILLVVDKFINALDVLLAEKKVTIDLSITARAWLADKGYSAKFGARPMNRVIQTEIKRPLADEILFGRLMNGGHVEVDVDTESDKLTMTFSELDEPSGSGSDKTTPSPAPA
ncbi:MAG: ATP-dependent Clp protease ATP-binding subunit ClpA [Myxococcales bacterium]|nr:ATP-dependent Clp protease ATP-binding subunit ClpA [Myxococcales bacterium]